MAKRIYTVGYFAEVNHIRYPLSYDDIVANTKAEAVKRAKKMKRKIKPITILLKN